jgi:formylglycine-generating enzyme required for sulfatase activity
LGKYEVTQEQWEAVMETNPSKWKGDGAHPVECVSWEDTQEFIRRLNMKKDGASYYLPTETEWEYAARAGSTTDYSFGDDPGQLGEYAWYIGNSGGRTHPVGQRKPNAWGLYDMYGNVWEWVQDHWYEGLQGRVIRGGSWDHDAGKCRSRISNHELPDVHYANIGFRCASSGPST